MCWAITGGAGFLGLHLARRLLAGGNEVRTLDLAPLDDAELERSVEEVRGDVRDPVAATQLAHGADVLVHAAAALPIQASRNSIRSVNVDGTAVVLAAALEAGVRRAVLISSTAVYGVPSGPSARRVAGPARPSTGSPARRWNALVASTVLGPAIASTGPL